MHSLTAMSVLTCLVSQSLPVWLLVHANELFPVAAWTFISAGGLALFTGSSALSCAVPGPHGPQGAGTGHVLVQTKLLVCKEL